MPEESTSKLTTSYWIIAGAMLVWNAIGLVFYYQQSTLTPELMADAGLTAQQIAHITNTPAWGHSGYAIAVNAGVLGAIFFGGLWWTVRKGVSSPRPALLFIGSLVLRTSFVLSGFYFIGRGDWQRLLLCLLGFVMARLAMTWLTRSSGASPTRPAPGARHAP